MNWTPCINHIDCCVLNGKDEDWPQKTLLDGGEGIV